MQIDIWQPARLLRLQVDAQRLTCIGYDGLGRVCDVPIPLSQSKVARRILSAIAHKTPDQVDYYALRCLAAACLCPQEHQSLQEEAVTTLRWLLNIMEEVGRPRRIEAKAIAAKENCEGWDLCGTRDTDGVDDLMMLIRLDKRDQVWANMSTNVITGTEDDMEGSSTVDEDEYLMIENANDRPGWLQDMVRCRETASVAGDVRASKSNINLRIQETQHILAKNPVVGGLVQLPPEFGLIRGACIQNDEMGLDGSGEVLYAFFKLMLGLGWKVVKTLPDLLQYIPFLGLWQQLAIGIVLGWPAGVAFADWCSRQLRMVDFGRGLLRLSYCSSKQESFPSHVAETLDPTSKKKALVSTSMLHPRMVGGHSLACEMPGTTRMAQPTNHKSDKSTLERHGATGGPAAQDIYMSDAITFLADFVFPRKTRPNRKKQIRNINFIMLVRSTLVSLLAAVALAAPANLDARADTVCGSNAYTSGEVKSAANTACQRVNADSQVNGYPHTYNNYEGFDFLVDGPYDEFPILTTGIYKGGSPGADRVVINDDCGIAGVITHTGASGNNFVGCTGAYGVST
ncbi:guanyl-specific ribonuclease f1 [Zalerion maritima]|uniref:ribonuclease T1 n=1 Tax=Zalerion maritima TaxID=339359 RepID=A0AAD5RGH2_9PEZI|nr:guanyl-specific ribonuclease f1 [Zalerion maritima]